MSLVDALNRLLGRAPAQAEAQPSRVDLGVDPQHGEGLSTAFRSDGAESIHGEGGEPAAPDAAASEDDKIALPVLGRATAASHQRHLLALLGIGVLTLVLFGGWLVQRAQTSARQLTAVGEALTQSQRLVKAFDEALGGRPKAFEGLADSSRSFSRNIQALTSGNSELGVKALGASFRAELEDMRPIMERVERYVSAMQAQTSTLVETRKALQAMNQESGDWLRAARGVAARAYQGGDIAAMDAAGRLATLTQRIILDANLVYGGAGVGVQAQLDEDVANFRTLTQRNPQLVAGPDGAALLALYDENEPRATLLLDSASELSASRSAQSVLLADAEPARESLEAIQSKLTAQAGYGVSEIALLAVLTVFVLLCGVGIARVQLRESERRQLLSEQQRQEARLQELEAKRINDANQAAILRLMNELQSVAEGDLTQEATVTEDITGAIADSVNYTVEELRVLVGSVQNTATRVAQTTTQVDGTSTELLAASSEQLREIRETGQSVLDMATRINQVSSQAQESASVAQQSRQAADEGLKAVQNAIGGMNAIRDQIQDTSKRIKRLGESSQEIGEITELISGITEQTNLLALNAAIQAASAGEAGRGFSVVAEEVQRLAERSADATRQIAALVKAIQTDTQDAVAAMERSTRGVVEGARLSDSAGTALSEIDNVSRKLAELIESISSATLREASLANGVAENIQHIFAVTEQTGEGTRTTAHQVRELSKMAEELRQSVARFKIA
ncbi:methyl-accepting chemotaxis protein [Comamonas sp. NLF-1-9]|uniref:methyl-accepting chemotaxis protein n=1 Tax=Comamonas sp. NLF-1-9 TaxID=2853163 RepID=UPI001C493011|nr:methyl-accepting chemotaxis protein [Comamonas sp. NLF-1-9]QXL84426.1 type IV pili methyl-accepting chemotaxis transducer N-terminal domain-containing protein [Comamonas sp. NLF-1-9]